MWNLPNILTMLRIVLVPFFVWFLLADDGRHGLWRWAAVVAFAVAIYTDKLGRGASSPISARSPIPLRINC